MNNSDPKKLKDFISLTDDKSNIHKFINGNHLFERAKKVILSKIDNNKNYLSGYFIFMDDGYYYCIKPPYDFYKFDTFDELIKYIVDKYTKHKYNLSTFDIGKKTQVRVLGKIDDYYKRYVGNLVFE